VVIHLGQILLSASSGLTRKKGGQPYIFPIWPCSRCGLPSQPVTRLLVSSYLTFSPLPGLNLEVLPWRYIFCGTSVKISL